MKGVRMGSIMVHGACIACGTVMTFNPLYVPSIRIEGKREPLCRGCHAAWNRIHRTSQGLPPVPLHPLAYAPSEEHDL
jgi:hypothetical protein